MKNNEKFLIFFFCFLAVLRVNAQKTINIGAIIEDNTFLWTLESMEQYSDSTIITWKIKTKFPKTRMHLPQNVQIKDLNSGTIFQSSFIGEKIDSKNTVFFKREFEFQRFTTRFPAISDSAIISIFITPRLFIDSLYLESSSLFYDVHKYKTPVYNHAPLLTKNDSILYSNELYLQGIDYYKKRLYQLAIFSFEKALSVERQLRSFELYWRLGDDFNESLWLSNCYYKLGITDEAKQISSNYFVEPYDKTLRREADSLSMISDTIYDYSKLCFLKEICVLDSSHIGGNSFRYAESLCDLGCQYSSMREFQKAKHAFERAKAIVSERYKEKNWLIAYIYKNLASISYNENDIVSAIRYMKRSLLEERDTLYIIDDSSTSSDYNTLANYYSYAGDWETALRIMANRVDYWYEMYKKDPKKVLAPLGPWMSYYDNKHAYSEALSDYASFYIDAGLPKKALRTYKESLDVLGGEYSFGEYKNLGYYYYMIKDYGKAILFYELAAKDYLFLNSDNPNNNSTDYYLNIQNSIAMSYASMGDVKNAIIIQKDIICKADSSTREREKIFGQWEADFDTYADYISNLARYYNLNHQYDSAIIYEKKSLDIKLKYKPIENNLAYSYMNLGYAYMGLRQWNEALKFTLEAFNIYSQTKENLFYTRSLMDLVDCFFLSRDTINLEKYTPILMAAVTDDLLLTLQDLTYDERSNFLDNYSDLINQKIPKYSYYYPLSDLLAGMTYNASLLLKGALLNSENSIRRIINESNDASLNILWEELRADKYILSKQLEKDSLNRLLNTDSLQNVIYNLEDSLIIKCKGYDDITKSMKLKWQDIQESLSTQDLAIEFLSFPIENDSVMYAALTLRKDGKSPKLITLFEENQLKNISDTLCYHSKDMTQLVWEPLLLELQGVKNIYFSPAGALYNIGIEYLPGMEDYNIYRLSSTRELVNRGETNVNNRAVLYGGLDYDAKLDTLSQSRSQTKFSEKFVDHSDVRSMKYRGGQEKLTHTLDEVEQIEKELNSSQWVCLLDTISLGTEESFKSLSGKKINTLHIATHGFYYTPEESDHIGYAFLLPNNQTSAEDKSLSRSGLLMSGANHILDGDSIPENVEDGILTAKEIADVDLRGLDLVVLSACQTGLGDISQGEGVFGLQRGFKKAGANSILMSLWEVNDEATQILMTQFYKNLVSGQSKRMSLRYAQKYLREYNNGCFNEPKYWAAFILLDGIEKN